MGNPGTTVSSHGPCSVRFVHFGTTIYHCPVIPKLEGRKLFTFELFFTWPRGHACSYTSAQPSITVRSYRSWRGENSSLLNYSSHGPKAMVVRKTSATIITARSQPKLEGRNSRAILIMAFRHGCSYFGITIYHCPAIPKLEGRKLFTFELFVSWPHGHGCS